jgi:hypothetical protein
LENIKWVLENIFKKKNLNIKFTNTFHVIKYIVENNILKKTDENNLINGFR